MARLALALATVTCCAFAGDVRGQGGGARNPQGRPKTDLNLFRTEVPASRGSVVLGRPTERTVTLSVLLSASATVRVAYGSAGAVLDRQTDPLDLKAGEPREVQLTGLTANTAYEYRVLKAETGLPLLPEKGNGAFRTARPSGAPFVFTVQADSHLDGNCDPQTYAATLAHALADKPDFHIDLGDTFMTEKHASRDTAFKQYLAQRYYLGQLCQAAPLFLVLGNHDGESPRGRTDEGDDLSIWSNTVRKRYFPNPVPDAFYSGNSAKRADLGTLQDYYAWTWGDALFVVLDPYWFKQPQRGRNDNWKRTLGPEQYRWLERTLESSRAPFRFVFIHQLVGGIDSQARGGVTAAPFFEWGGRNLDGSDGFAANRPDWTAPIHQLLVRNHVNVVFHGHDHLYAREELDGIVYQEVPQPGAPNADARSAAEYGYKSGVILGGSGYLRIAVSAKQARVEFVRADGTVAHAYTLPTGAGG